MKVADCGFVQININKYENQMILRTIFVILCLAGIVSNRACAQDVALKTN